MNYRPDIDGIRAIAVLAVILYHFGVAGFSGGFVGVDVFFVISGYLITRLIVGEVTGTGRFDFGNFYLRRARRLFPALFVVLACCFVASYFRFSPDEFRRFSGALVHAIASLSNFYFWSESGYFDADAVLKPLLHTWSLAVEEQFYLFWPAMIALSFRFGRKFGAPAIILAVSLLSFYGNHVFHNGQVGLIDRFLPSLAPRFQDGAATIFYLTPFRVFEFGIGAIVLWAPQTDARHNWLREILLVAGLVLVAVSVTTYSDAIVFPYYNALMPCLGTALLIYAGQARYAGWLLRNPVSVGIGLISYSAYLIHWPLWVFYSYGRLDAVTPLGKVALVVVTLVLAVLMYRFVETPFRRPRKDRPKLGPAAFGLTCTMAAFLLILPASNAWANGGWPGRIKAVSFADFQSLDKLMVETTEFAKAHFDLPTFDAGRNRVLVIGDSHSTDAANALGYELGSEFQVRRQWFHPICWRNLDPANPVADKKCPEEVNQLRNSSKLHSADFVVVSSLFGREGKDDAQLLIDFIRTERPNAKIIFLGQSVGFWKFHQYALSAVQEGETGDDLNAEAYRRFYKPSHEFDDEMRSKLVLDANTVFVSKVDAICEKERCMFVLPNNHLVVWDMSHWTMEGGRAIMARILEQNPGLFSQN
ncbi:MAG TPA: acyltransferase family protein [Hyphomonas sp.]|nr:acyltransferase [Hyphomonas sp.]MCB9962204.1 acyltransferase [Hyphomonas sp.]HPE49322.1 acyltransferase family protein [Hyphomonas sp.]